MKLEQQVCSLELSKRLKELGVKQESLFYWYGEWYDPNPPFREKAKRWYIELAGYVSPEKDIEDTFSAFTVAELGEMLPMIVNNNDDTNWLYTTKHDDGYSVQYGSIENNSFNIVYEQYSDTEADARAKILIYLLENDMI